VVSSISRVLSGRERRERLRRAASGQAGERLSRLAKKSTAVATHDHHFDL